jgi:hypothetical protein
MEKVDVEEILSGVQISLCCLFHTFSDIQDLTFDLFLTFGM